MTAWLKQREILFKLLGCLPEAGPEFLAMAVPEGGWSEVWVAAAHGVGKTFLAALTALYWFSVLEYAVITTAPTGHQVRNLLWQQGIATLRMKARIRLPGRLLETAQIKVAGRPDWFMRGFSTDTPEGAQGVHLDNLLIICDEVAGIATAILNALKGYFTNPGVKMLCIGNPNGDRRSEFYKAFHERRGEVGLVQISALECPHVPAKWVEDRKKEWGENSIEYITKVLGQWPPDGDEKVIPLDWILAARDFWYTIPVEVDDQEPEKAALDVAREGPDKNALAKQTGQKLWLLKWWKQKRTTKTAGEVFDWLKALDKKPKYLVVDANAVGGGVVDALRDLWEEQPDEVDGCILIALNWDGSADDKLQYDRCIDELYWRLRLALNPEADPSERLALPPDEVLQALGVDLTFDMLAAQLNARRYEVNSRARIKVESKKELRKRKVCSPDAADALAALMFVPKVEEIVLF